MGHVHIPKDDLERLLKKYTAAAVGERYGVSRRTVINMATRHGLNYYKCAKKEQPGETARVIELHLSGMCTNQISVAMNRSEDFINRRIWAYSHPEELPHRGAPKRELGPMPTTTSNVALHGKWFDDVPPHIRHKRENPLNIVDGARYARSKLQASIGTSAGMCADFA